MDSLSYLSVSTQSGYARAETASVILLVSPRWLAQPRLPSFACCAKPSILFLSGSLVPSSAAFLHPLPEHRMLDLHISCCAGGLLWGYGSLIQVASLHAAPTSAGGSHGVRIHFVQPAAISWPTLVVFCFLISGMSAAIVRVHC